IRGPREKGLNEVIIGQAHSLRSRPAMASPLRLAPHGPSPRIAVYRRTGKGPVSPATTARRGYHSPGVRPDEPGHAGRHARSGEPQSRHLQVLPGTVRRLDLQGADRALRELSQTGQPVWTRVVAGNGVSPLWHLCPASAAASPGRPP